MSNNVVDFGQVLQVSETSLSTGAQTSAAINPGRCSRLRFYSKHTRSAGSAATTTSVKLQCRYNNGSIVSAYQDLPSYLDDAQGAAQPKGPTLEVTHAVSTPANVADPGTPSDFYVDARGLVDVVLVLTANATGQAGDVSTIYAVGYLD